jgi:DNA repair exonuclease SbcCD ATPase subunit
MKLILKNFKCWQDKTIDLGGKGINFLNGPSGAGKSSIFDALNFAITGDGKNLVSYGSNSLRVELVNDEYSIIRTKRPNRLIFKYNNEDKDKEYEDDEAQVHINRHFSKLFSVISYINQNDTESFLKMSPTEKIEFLESLAFQNLDISEKKDRIKEILKERNTKLLSVSSKLQSTKSILDNIKEIKEPYFPVKCTDGDVHSVISKYRKLSITKPQKLESISKQIMGFEKDLLSVKSSEEKTIILNEELDSIMTNILEIKEQLKNNNYDETEYNKIIDTIKHLENSKKYSEKVNKISEDLSLFRKKREELLSSEYSDKSFPEESEDDVLNILKDLDEYYNDIKTLNLHRTKLLQLKNDEEKELSTPIISSIELQERVTMLQSKVELYNLSKVLLCCPDCGVKLSFVHNALKKYTGEVVDNDPKNELKEAVNKLENMRKREENLRILQSKIADLQGKVSEIESKYDDIQTIEEITETRNSYESYLQENRRLKQKYTIEKDTNARLLRSIDNDIQKLESEKNKYNSLITVIYDENEHKRLNTLLLDINSAKKMYYSQNNLLENFETRYIKINDELKQYITIINTKDSILQNITELNVQKLKLEEEISKITLINEKITEYINNKKEYDNWVVIYNQFRELEQEESRAKDEVNSITLLKDKFILAESIYLNTFISTLSEHVQSYVNMFFTDDPMTITIKPFKTVKKDSKPQINLEIGYKGMECDVSTLSGGERDRLNLAFILSFSEIMTSPILLLDECISSLDYVNFNNVLMSLKENYKGDMILLISHQANEGVFDKIININ